MRIIVYHLPYSSTILSSIASTVLRSNWSLKNFYTWRYREDISSRRKWLIMSICSAIALMERISESCMTSRLTKVRIINRWVIHLRPLRLPSNPSTFASS